MKSFLVVLLASLVVACSQKDKVAYSMPDEKEVNEVVETILLRSKNPIFVDQTIIDTTSGFDRNNFNREETLVRLNVELEKFTVVRFDVNSENKIPDPPHSIPFITLIEFNHPDTSKFFTLSDSTYIQYQNNQYQHFAYTGAYLKQLNIVKASKSIVLEKSYYGVSVPIFSMDQKTAYVEVTYHCSEFCSEAYGYILVKKNDSWTIAKKKLIWIS